jgi:hypothetical protein
VAPQAGLAAAAGLDRITEVDPEPPARAMLVAVGLAGVLVVLDIPAQDYPLPVLLVKGVMVGRATCFLMFPILLR